MCVCMCLYVPKVEARPKPLMSQKDKCTTLCTHKPQGLHVSVSMCAVYFWVSECASGVCVCDDVLPMCF